MHGHRVYKISAKIAQNYVFRFSVVTADQSETITPDQSETVTPDKSETVTPAQTISLSFINTSKMTTTSVNLSTYIMTIAK